MKRIEWNNLSEIQKRELLMRPALSQRPGLTMQVSALIDIIKKDGDKAVRELTQKFDKVSISEFKVTEEEYERAEKNISAELRSALERAFAQIKIFHEKQKREDYSIETSPGVLCERRFSPIEKVGLYVPGGSAVLPSTMLMMGVPALLAGAKLRIVCTPPSISGEVNSALLVAAKLCQVENVFKIGGAQAIAAMAYGTESIPKVDKIFGPGNAYVTQAKTLVAQDPYGAASDLPAGPSEVLVIADGSAPASFTAADLLSQAEHGPDSQVLLISTSKELIDEVLGQLNDQVSLLPRGNIAQQALENSLAIQVQSIEEAIDISESYAPEHLILHIKDAREQSQLIKNAGSVFIGQWSPESVGDYASGTNHVLPTYGFAKTYSGLSLDAFYKSTTFQELTPAGLLDIASTVESLARCEDLVAHERAVSLRRQYIKGNML